MFRSKSTSNHSKRSKKIITMFSQIVASLLILQLASARQVQPLPVCALNEKYLECGTACPSTCQNRNEVRACEEICISGCFCQEGYVRRSENGRCVPVDSCEVQVEPVEPISVCSQNEEYRECGTACPTTCQNRNEVRACEEICISGCFCKEGYVRGSTNGACVPVDTCEAHLEPVKPVPVCAAHEEFHECGTACPTTCQNRNQLIVCEDICLQGCYCKEGYVRRSENGPCVPMETCDAMPQCRAHEVFSDCATPCPQTCEDDGQVRMCPDICFEGCVCEEGYIKKTRDGPCVPKNTCLLSDGK